MLCQKTGRRIKTTRAKPDTLMEAAGAHMTEDENRHSQTALSLTPVNCTVPTQTHTA